MTKTRITFYITKDMVEKAKNAAYWTPGLTLSALAEQAIARHVETLEQQRGEPFPRRDNDLAKGRPAK
jgi:post-segregation antitoxin (ccd killing protein)